MVRIIYRDAFVVEGRTEDELVSNAEAYIRERVRAAARRAPFVLGENGIDPTTRLSVRSR
jgi:hypothetical protein